MNPYDTLERQLSEVVQRRLGHTEPAAPTTATLVPPGPPRRAGGAGTAPGVRRRGRRSLGVAAAIALAAAAIVALAPGQRGAVDLAARAYAATSGAGVIHWRTEIVNRRNGRRTMRQREEGWSAGGVQHIVSYDVRRKAHVTGDMRIADGRATSFGPLGELAIRGPAPSLATSGGIVFGDPFEAFRIAHRAGELVALGGGRYRVDPSRLKGGLGRVARVSGSGASITYVIDRRTARPLQLVYDSRRSARTDPPFQHAAAHDVTTMTFAVYERLADTGANRARLALLPHPGPSKTDPATLYSPLRTGRPLTVRQHALTTGMSRSGRFSLEIGRARQAADGTVLIPGRGTMCMMSGGGGTCAGLRAAVRYGLATGSSGRGLTIVVPDGVRALRARLPRHPWRMFPVHDNVVHLPNGGYHWRFVR